MKTAKQWVLENSQSGAFDSVGDIEDATIVIEEIQKDAVASIKGDVRPLLALLRAFGNNSIVDEFVAKYPACK